MLSYNFKRSFFFLAGPIMRLNGVFYKAFRQPKNAIKVQLGPGQRNYLQGWVNVDANMFTAKTDLWSDFSHSLPLRDKSVTHFYSHHVIEHIRDDLLQNHFNEMHRCLVSGGIIRVGGPNIDSAIKKYIENDVNWFSDFPRKRSSIGGRFVNLLFCANEHLSALTPSYLQELAMNAGFEKISFCLPTKETTGFPTEVLDNEWETDFENPRTLIMEAYKS